MYKGQAGGGPTGRGGGRMNRSIFRLPPSSRTEVKCEAAAYQTRCYFHPCFHPKCTVQRSERTPNSLLFTPLRCEGGESGPYFTPPSTIFTLFRYDLRLDRRGTGRVLNVDGWIKNPRECLRKMPPKRRNESHPSSSALSRERVVIQRMARLLSARDYPGVSPVVWKIGHIGQTFQTKV